jgi:hypothetical protein
LLIDAHSDEVEVETSFGGTRLIYSYQANNLIISYAAGLLASLVLSAWDSDHSAKMTLQVMTTEY